MSNLESVFGESNTNNTIYQTIFSNADKLKLITFGSNTQAIGNTSFSGTSICHVNIPNSVSSIGYGAFFDCEKLKSINFIDGGDTKLTIGGEILNGTEVTSLQIPNRIESLKCNAFYNTKINTVFYKPSNSDTTLPNKYTDRIEIERALVQDNENLITNSRDTFIRYDKNDVESVKKVITRHSLMLIINI